MKSKTFNIIPIAVLLLSFTYILFSAIPFAYANSVLGNSNTLSTTITFAGANYVYFYGPFTAQATGPINTVYVYMNNSGASCNVLAGVYSDNSNAPNALLASSSQVTIPGGTSYTWYAFSVSLQVNSTSKYWFATISDGNVAAASQSSGGTTKAGYRNMGSFSLPATASYTLVSSTYQVSIYTNILTDPFTVSNIFGFAKAGMNTTFSANWDTNETLQSFIVQSNQTGTVVNSTAQAFSSAWSNYTGAVLPLNGTWVGWTIQWKIYANTTLGMWLDTGLQNMTIQGTPYMITGPYVEDNGYVANSVVSGTVYFSNGMSQTFTLNGTSGTAQSYLINPSYTPLSVTWQAIANYSYIREYYLTSTSAANITVFVPNSASTPQIYQFTVSDFYGITTPYIASALTVGGNLTSQLYIIERRPLTVGTVSLIMEQWHSYTMLFQCDQGTYSIEFSAEGTFLTNINIPSGVFPATNLTIPVADAQRVNGNTVTATYTDPSSNTTWVNVAIYHKNGFTLVNDYSINLTGSPQTLTWSQGDSALDYMVNVTALSNSKTYRFSMSAPAPAAVNPFMGLLDWLGPVIRTVPHVASGWPAGANPSQLIAGIVICAALCVGSFRSTGPACLIAWLVGGLMIYLGWWQSAIPIWSFAGFISILIAIDEWRQNNGGMIAT